MQVLHLDFVFPSVVTEVVSRTMAESRFDLGSAEANRKLGWIVIASIGGSRNRRWAEFRAPKHECISHGNPVFLSDRPQKFPL